MSYNRNGSCKSKIIIYLLLLISSYSLADDKKQSIQSSPAAANKAVYHHPEAFINSLKNDPQAGEKIYKEFCQSCHAQDPLIELGAPRIGEAGDWKLRLKKGMDGLLKSTNEGLNNMPPRGGCFECSDEQLQAAIKYMLPKTKQQNK